MKKLVGMSRTWCTYESGKKIRVKLGKSKGKWKGMEVVLKMDTAGATFTVENLGDDLVVQTGP